MPLDPFSLLCPIAQGQGPHATSVFSRAQKAGQGPGFWVDQTAPFTGDVVGRNAGTYVAKWKRRRLDRSLLLLGNMTCSDLSENDWWKDEAWTNFQGAPSPQAGSILTVLPKRWGVSRYDLPPSESLPAAAGSIGIDLRLLSEKIKSQEGKCRQDKPRLKSTELRIEINLDLHSYKNL
jgi:hypothetical protein